MTNDHNTTARSLQMRSERVVITATIAFVNILALKALAPQLAYRAVVALNGVLRSCLGTEIGSLLDVLSTLTGAILVIPDSSSIYIHERLAQLGAEWSRKGIPVRVGVAHGEIEVLSDVDDMRNAIGAPVNIAARLATAKPGPGCVLHSSYLDAMASVVDNAPFLRGSRKTKLSGKVHDKKPMLGRQIAAAAFPRVDRIDDHLLPGAPSQVASVNGVALGYDLPQFSAGDRSELSKRFRSISDVFKSLRSEHRLDASPIYFSPGGDGGILVTMATKLEGLTLADRLTALLSVESTGREKKIQVTTRLGMQYGAIALYENAAGITRPTGPVCFVADAVASDQKPDDVNFRGVVITEVFADAAGDGSRERFEREFEELPALSDGPAKGLRRFVRRRGGDLKQDPLFTRLTTGSGSWEPIR